MHFFFLAKLTHVRFMSYMRKRKEDLPSISDAEWVLMRIIWGQGRVTANDLVDAVGGLRDWKPKTIKTLLRRLTDKEVLGYEKAGREYVFYPLVEQEEAEKAQSQSFIHRIFEGQAVPFLARFLKSENLSAEEISELKAILDKKSS